MALKAVLGTRVEFDALPEVVRKEYIEKDGRFMLAVEGDLPEVAELKTRVGEFRNNNIALTKEVEELRPLKARFEGIDPEEYKRIKTEVEELRSKGIGKPDDVQTLVRAEIAKAQKPLLEKLTASEQREAAAQKRLEESEFERIFREATTKAGVKPTAVPDAIARARQTFETKDGKIVPRADVRHPDPAKELTPETWVIDVLPKEAEHLFVQNEGGGANGGRRPLDNARVLVNPTPEQMGRNLDDLASGKVKVSRT